MNFDEALRIPLYHTKRIAFVGAGGKTTAMFQLARELAPVLVTTSTHLGAWQASSADRHYVWSDEDPLPDIEAQISSGLTLITGGYDEKTGRLHGLTPSQLNKLDTLASTHDLPLLVEADGARQLPLKAPAAHEPDIPTFINIVVVVAGLSAIGKRLLPNWVHRVERFSELSHLKIGSVITPEALVAVLKHPQGGRKNIPNHARCVALLNQADTQEQQSAGKGMTRQLIQVFDSIIISSSNLMSVDKPLDGTVYGRSLQVYAVYESIAGIILAAGGALRFGRPKQLLEWEGESFLRRVTRVALEAGLSPVIVVTGACADEVAKVIRDLPIRIVNNLDWQTGQGSSVRTGVQALPEENGAVIFLLADQPMIASTLIHTLKAEHTQTLAPIIAPLVNGQRGNPVLFDKVTFPDLLKLTGDIGGKALFSRYPVTWLPWHDKSALVDVDTEEDYQKLVGE